MTSSEHRRFAACYLSSTENVTNLSDKVGLQFWRRLGSIWLNRPRRQWITKPTKLMDCVAMTRTIWMALGIFLWTPEEL